ncbi:metallophosphoesterase family protein [Providencia sp. Me31A]|uniref:metallophosphoesterase family protein n=1 Tax=Providencia sp. Me31A TaxID=3392637 RepID=UPI003D2DD690
MKIGLISDIHNDSNKTHNILLKSIVNIFKNGAIGLVMSGDIANSHGRRQASFQAFQNTVPTEYHKNLILMLGNHDVRTGASHDGSLDPDLVNLYQDYLKSFGVSTTSNTMCVASSINNYHFLCLNTDLGLKDMMELKQESIDWLKIELAKKAEPEKPIFIVTHQPLNSSHWRAGLFGGFGKQDAEIKQIFADYPQIVLLNGHIHNGLGVIEFIQRPFGSLVEIPSLTRSENGVKKSGTGWMLNIEKNRLIFEAWNFYENHRLKEYDKTLEIPLFPVLANKLKNCNDDEGKQLAKEANHFMSLMYKNDTPLGDLTIQAPSFYGIKRNYDNDTWLKIINLREKIIKYN